MDIQPYKISLDFYIRKIIIVNAKQLDSDSRIINITCTENGKKFFVDSSTTSAFVRYKKSDDYEVLNEVSILDDGTVDLKLSQQMLAAEGRQLVDIMLINGTSLTTETVESILNSETMDGISVLSTMYFYINTEGVAIDGSEIESSYEYDALIDGLGKMVAVDNRMSELDKTVSENESQRQDAEDIRTKNETDRINAEKEREVTIKECITVTENAKKVTSEANEATQNANMATNSANEVTKTAIDTISEMNEIAERINQSISTVINDNLISESTTYSSSKLEDMFCIIFQSSTEEPVNQGIGGLWFCEE